MDLQKLSKEELIEYIKLLEKALLNEDFKKYFISSVFASHSSFSIEEKFKFLKNYADNYKLD